VRVSFTRKNNFRINLKGRLSAALFFVPSVVDSLEAELPQQPDGREAIA
jgi:hypothetical protein